MARRTRGFEKKIDHTAWDGFTLTSSSQAAGSLGFNFLTTALDRPVTIMRIRGEFIVWVDGAQATGRHAIVTAGIIKVPTGTGTTVLLNPITDDKASWMWYTSVSVGYEEMVTDVIDVPGLTAVRVEVDNKAMRIVRPDEELQLVITNSTGIGAVSINATMTGRMLIGF